MTVTVTGLAIALMAFMVGTAVTVAIGLAIEEWLHRRELKSIRAAVKK